MKSKQAQFEKELTEKMKEIELLKDQLQKKQAAFAELEIVSIFHNCYISLYQIKTISLRL